MQRNYQQTVGRVRVDRPYPEWWPKRHDYSGKRETVCRLNILLARICIDTLCP